MGEERQDARTTPPGRKLTVSEAAEHLNISAEAVRSRIKRGTLRSVKEGSTVYVLLAGDQTTDQTRPDEAQTSPEPDRTSDQTALLEHLEAEISYLREQLDAERAARTEERRRADTVIAQLSQANAEQARTIRALEAPASEPQEPQNQAEDAGRRPDRVETPGEQETATERRPRRGFLRRIFGG